MSVVSVSNVHLNTAGSTRFETIDNGANVRIVIESANVMYSNPVRTVFPTGTVNVANELNVTGRSRITNANVTGDITVTGNVFSAGSSTPLSPPVAYVPYVYRAVASGSNPVLTDIPVGRTIKFAGKGTQPGGGGQVRMYLSSDNGATYGAATTIAIDSGSSGDSEIDILIANTGEVGVSKTIRGVYRNFRANGFPVSTSTISATESAITGVINAIKANCAGGNWAGAAVYVEVVN